LGLLVFIGSLTSPAAQRWEWWHDVAVQRELVLSPQQVQSLDLLFQRDLSRRRALRTALEAARTAFDRALADGDEASALALIGRVADLESEQNVARTTLLLRMSWVLSTVQQTKLRVLRSRRARRGDVFGVR
jgi:Spy/CpxP family protein refolding chaperone